MIRDGSSLNMYEDKARAEAYASLGGGGTYFLAFRALASILPRYAVPGRVLDFGCGAGRSTRFLRRFGFDVLGVDISQKMVDLARLADPNGDYRLTTSADLKASELGSFSLVMSCWAFDNVRPPERKLDILKRLHGLIATDGAMVLVVSTPELYQNEWVSFTTKDYPRNRKAGSGDTVSIRIKRTSDERPYEDTLCTDHDYRVLFVRPHFYVAAEHRPLGCVDDPYAWISELSVAPWVIYELSRSG